MTTDLVFYVLAVIGCSSHRCRVKHTGGYSDYFRADKARCYIASTTWSIWTRISTSAH